MPPQPDTTVVLTTHNRRDLLKQAIEAARTQSVSPQIIVCDDASTDDTPAMMREGFPEIEYLRSDESRGPCYQRNRGIKAAKTEIVFPLDDDSILVSPTTLAETLTQFNNPRVAIVAIPYINILKNREVRSAAPQNQENSPNETIWAAHSFVAASHAVRKTPFLNIGGYCEELFYMGEEGDLSLRLLARGYVTRLGSAPPIHHHQPPNRISPLAERFGRRNDILFYHAHAPAGARWRSLLTTSAAGLLRGLKTGRLPSTVSGLIQGYRDTITGNIERHPINPKIYSLYIELKRRGPKPLHEIEPLLPPIA